MMIALDLLDRDIARAAVLARVEASPEAVNPLGRTRAVSSRAVYLELGEMPATPLGDAARTWVAALTLERVLWPDRVRVVASRGAPEVLVTGAGAEQKMSVDAALLRLLEDAEPARRRIVARGLAKGADGARGAARIWAERRAEAARQLGIELDDLEVPVEPRAAIFMAAEKLIEVTDPLVPRAVEAWSDAIDPLVARDAGEGWPAHLTARWMLSVFERSALFEGLRLAPVALPALFGAASFARALGGLGAAYADAVAPAGAPFCLSRAPFDIHRARRSALFAGLAADPVFFARALDLGKARARDQARRVAGALVLSLRLDAARVLLRGVLVRVPAAAAQRWEEVTELALGSGVSGLLTGVLPRLDPGDAARFAGSLLAAADRRALVERSDEDWFRSPHAARLLREEDEGRTPELRTDREELERGVAEIARVLKDLG